MTGLFSEIKIKNLQLKNRIVFPAMLTCDIDVPGGFVNKAYLEQYKWLCERGVSMIVAGASYVSPNGKMTAGSQLGVCSDEYIDGLSKIAALCHEKGVAALMLINHAGANAQDTDDVVASSEIDYKGRKSRSLTLEEIKKYQKDYVDAAVRCEKAGFDGVQVQCSHNYLFDSFISGILNKRTDEYGGSIENRARIVLEVIREIKKKISPDFIVSVRLPYNSPEIEDSVKIAKMLEEAGVDYLEISWGTINMPQLLDKMGPQAPDEFKFGDIPYGAWLIKQNVSIPVGSVWQIKSDEANEIIENGYADTVDVLRGILIDPDWVENAKEGKASNKCFDCKPACRWYFDRTKCPQWNKLDEKVRLNITK